MKQSFQTLGGWLAAVGFLSVAGSSLAFGPQVERSLELNGITDIPGYKRALFVLVQPDVWAMPRSFMLAVGESSYGIKLLAIDATSSRAKIEKDGLKQVLKIHSTVNLFPSTFLTDGGNPEIISSKDDGDLVISANPNNPSNAADNRLAGNPGYGSLPANEFAGPAPGKNSTPGPATTQGSNPNKKSTTVSNPNGANPAIALQDQSQAEWYQESLNIEQQRVQTAQQVLAGEMTPWPLTPLTPSGTSSALVDPKAFYSDHIPGYRQPLDF